MSGREKKGGNRQQPALDLHSPTVVRAWVLFFLLVFFILFLLLLWKAVTVLLLLFAGALVALALRFLSDQISRLTSIPPLVSLTLIVVLLVGGGTAGTILAAPSISQQFQKLAENLKDSITNLERRLSERGFVAEEWLPDMGTDGGLELWTQAAGVFTMTFGAVAGFFLTLTIGLFLAYNPGLYFRGFLRLIPISKRKRAREIMSEVADTLRWWMVGQLISMVVLAVSTSLMLWLIGVPLAFILGLLTGALTFIPYLGPLIALIPILLVAFAEGPAVMVTILIFYLIIQNLEASVLMPIILQKTVHLPPVLTIIAQILLGAIFGFVGIILATPLMAAGITLVKMIYVVDLLGDSFEKEVKVPDS